MSVGSLAIGRRTRAVLAVAAFVWIGSGPSAAHIPAYGIGTASLLVFEADRVRITFDLSYDGYWAQAEMVAIDADGDQAIDEREADAYLSRQWEAKIAPRLRAFLDGKDAPIRKSDQRHDGLVGEIYPAPFSLYYDLEVDLPPPSAGKETVFELEDQVVRDETPAKPRFSVPYEGHASGGGARFALARLDPGPPRLETDGYLLEAPRLSVRFRMEPTVAPGAPEPPPGTPPAPAAPSAPPERGPAPGTIESAMRRSGELRWYEVLACIALATIAGAGHALAPGHGKAMVAAYLIGTRGRVRDAVTLGLATTVTHTGSVFLFGLALFLLVAGSTRASEAAVQNRIIVATQLVSGFLLFVLGATLFTRRLRAGGAGREHPHHHGHPHPHDHEAPAETARGLLDGGAPRFRELLALGFSGGLVPCPAGLTVVLLGLHFPDRLLFALLLLVFFSLGLGSVLVGIGVALVAGKALVTPGPRFLRAASLVSPLVIAGIGIAFCATTVSTGRVEIAALLRGLADWLQGSP